jgi:hypothetical protein
MVRLGNSPGMLKTLELVLKVDKELARPVEANFT